MKIVSAVILAVLFAAGAIAQSKVPTVDDLINVRSIGASRISPDGKWVAYTVTGTDWKQDAFVTHIWIVPTSGGEPFQLTRGDKSASAPQWSPDGRWIAFTSTRVGDKNQLFAIRPNGGEAVQLSKSENGVGSFAWSPDGKSIAYTSSDLDPKSTKERADQLGPFEVVRREYAHQHLWTLTVAEALTEPAAGKQRTSGKNYSIGGFDWSPDASRIAFSATSNPDLINGGTSDIYLLNLGDDAVKRIVSTPGPDNSPRFSPDGSRIVFSTAMGNPNFFHSNTRLAVVEVGGGTPRSLTDGFDEQPGLIEWNAAGIWFGGLQKTASHLFRLDPANGSFTRVSQPADIMLSGGSLSRDGKMMAFSAPSATSLTEIYVTATDQFAPRKLTSMTDQVTGYKLATREVITWKSRDGEPIEGVLIKPADFDPSKKYPVLCVIHGGPTGIDRPTLLDARYYPADIWAARGALVLKVNYRGSAGYGERFRQLNVRNLGVGDAWDVLSGIDHLIAKGWADPNRLGCMG